MDASRRNRVSWIATASIWVTVLAGGGVPAEAAPGEDTSEQAERVAGDVVESGKDVSEQTERPSRGEAAGWATSFQPSAPPESLTDRKVLVVAAGGRFDEAQAAARQLRQALQEAGAPLVMDDSNLEDVADRGDQAIVESAGPLPVEAILVVRVFGGGDGPSAVVSGYTPEGDALAGFDVRRGEALESGDTRDAGRGVSQETVDAIESATRGEPPGGRQNGRWVVSTSRNWRLTDRKEGDSYEGADIYRHLDRPDLLDAYQSNRRSLRTTRWIGAGIGAAGLVTTGIGLLMMSGESAEDPTADGTNQQSYPECENREFESVERNCRAEKQSESGTSSTGSGGSRPGRSGVSVAVGGGIAAAIGASFAIASLVDDPHPVSAEELARIARESDTGDAESGDESPQSARGPAVDWSIAPTNGGVQGSLRIRW